MNKVGSKYFLSQEGAKTSHFCNWPNRVAYNLFVIIIPHVTCKTWWGEDEDSLVHDWKACEFSLSND